MSAWLRQHRQALARGFGRIGSLNAVVIGVALALALGAYALIESLRAVAGRLTLEPQVSVFLDAKSGDADALGARLKRDPRVSRVRFVPREQAMKELAAIEGVSDLVAALGRNPLPDAFVVGAAEGEVESLAADVATWPGVAHVQADALWARRLATLARLARLGLWLLAGLLGAAVVSVTFNTIRLQVLTQRDEIEVSRLLGATDAFIRRPFYYAGMLQALAGSALALLLVAGSLALLNTQVGPLATSYGSDFRLSFVGAGDGLATVLFAGLLGWLGAHLSLRRHLD